MDLSVVIPIYNSAAMLEELLARLTEVLAPLVPRYELILVDDGSKDESWEVTSSLSERYGTLVTVQLMRNYGQHNALMCGLAMAKGNFIVTMDDDLQNPPEEIPKMLARIQQGGLDLVYGCPDTRSHAAWRNLGSAVVWRFYKKIFRNPVTPTPFRVMRHQLVRSV